MFWFRINQAQNDPSLNRFKLSPSSIPVDEIRRGGPPRDGIPAIDDPKFLVAKKAWFLNGEDRVLGVVVNGKSKAYPIRIMDYHEIVNDDGFVVTYCPLCGSGIAFKATVKGLKRTFGVSGLLYNSDVLLYDRETESLWSQILFEGVTGKSKGIRLEPIPTVNTTWKTWKKEHPETVVLSKETGHVRDYTKPLYGLYNLTSDLYFPVKNKNDRFHNKEKVIGIEVDGKFKAYPFSKLKKLKEPISDLVNGKKLKIEYDKRSKSAKIFNEKGKLINGLTLYWFAWYAFHPDTEVYE